MDSFWVNVYAMDHSLWMGYACHRPWWQTDEQLRDAVTRRWAYKGMYVEFEDR